MHFGADHYDGGDGSASVCISDLDAEEPWLYRGMGEKYDFG